MRIVIDMQGAQTASRFRGIGRYTTSLIEAMLKAGSDHEFWLVFNGAFPEPIDALCARFQHYVPRARMRTFELAGPVAWRKADAHWFAQAMEPVREAFIADLNPDMVLVTSLFEGHVDDAVVSIGVLPDGPPTAVIHYDLIPALNPEQYLQDPLTRTYYERRLASLKRADLLLAISDFSRLEVIDHLALPADRVVNISAAVSADFSADKTPLQSFAGMGIERPFVLCTPGGFDSRKNLPRLIEAYAGLPDALRAAHQLVITGGGPPQHFEALNAQAKAVGLAEGELVLPGYPDDAELRALYQQCEVFVFPSLHEGFGLPALEAMTCGAPVLASHCSSLPEVVGNPEALFDPEDVAAITAKLQTVLTEPTYRAALVDAGATQATRFSWDASAQRALAALAEWRLAQRPIRDAAVAPLCRAPEPVKLAERICAHLGDAASTSAPTTGGNEWEMLARALAVNLPLDAQPKLLLDVTELAKSDGKSGIQRVVKSLLLAFLAEPPTGYTVCPVRFEGGNFVCAHQFLARMTGQAPRGADAGVDFVAGDTYLSLDLNINSMPLQVPLFAQLRRRGVALAFIVYDLLPLLHPEWWPPEVSPRYEQWLRGLMGVASTVSCISAAVADELTAWVETQPSMIGPMGPPAILSFHLGADIDNSAPSKGVPAGADKTLSQLQQVPTFLMVGTLEPRKGHAQALAAFEQLWAEGVAANLVIVGKHGWLVDHLAAKLRAHPEQGTRLWWLEGVSDEYLLAIYQASDCLLAASEGEGFGLPLIEAAQHGLPILARDLPVFREVAGQHAHYFAGFAATDLATAVQEWLALQQQDAAPASTAMPWLTWRESARQLLQGLSLPPIDVTDTDTTGTTETIDTAKRA